MARRKKPREPQESTPLGRVLAILRTAFNLTQGDLGSLSGVKRSSISEYERGKCTPDAVTVERLLAAMNLRWNALDFGRWFVERLLLTLFRQAAERERVTAEFARDMLSYLHKARYDPELRFHKS